MVEIPREIPTFSHPVDSMLAMVILRFAQGEASASEVTSVLRRVCDESRARPPEALLLRIKELWTKVAGAPGRARDAGDRRYYTFIGEALALYFDAPSAPLVARNRGYAAQSGGEPEIIAPR